MGNTSSNYQEIIRPMPPDGPALDALFGIDPIHRERRETKLKLEQEQRKKEKLSEIEKQELNLKVAL